MPPATRQPWARSARRPGSGRAGSPRTGGPGSRRSGCCRVPPARPCPSAGWRRSPRRNLARTGVAGSRCPPSLPACRPPTGRRPARCRCRRVVSELSLPSPRGRIASAPGARRRRIPAASRCSRRASRRRKPGCRRHARGRPGAQAAVSRCPCGACDQQRRTRPRRDLRVRARSWRSPRPHRRTARAVRRGPPRPPGTCGWLPARRPVGRRRRTAGTSCPAT